MRTTKNIAVLIAMAFSVLVFMTSQAYATDSLTLMDGLNTTSDSSAPRICLIDQGVDMVLGVEERLTVTDYNSEDKSSDKHGTNGVYVIRSLFKNAKIVSVQVDSSKGIFYTKIAEAIKLCNSRNVDAISIPVAGPKPAENSLEYTSIVEAASSSVPVFAGAGNNGGETEFPASLPQIYAVGGFQQDDCSMTPARGAKIFIVVPLCHIPFRNDQGELGMVRGTSYTSSVVAATYAILHSKGINNESILNLIQSSSSETNQGKMLQIGKIFASAGFPLTPSVTSQTNENEEQPVNASQLWNTSKKSNKIKTASIKICKNKQNRLKVTLQKQQKNVSTKIAFKNIYTLITKKQMILPWSAEKVTVQSFSGNLKSKKLTLKVKKCS